MGGDSRVRGFEQPRLLTTEPELIIPAPRADRGRGAEAEGYSSAVLLVGTRGRWYSSLHLQIGTRLGTAPAPHSCHVPLHLQPL